MTWGSFKLWTFSHLIFIAQDIGLFSLCASPIISSSAQFFQLVHGTNSVLRWAKWHWFQSASDVCVDPRTMFFSVWNNHSHWFMPYIFKSAIAALHHLNQKHVNYPKSWSMQFVQESRTPPLLGQEKWLFPWLPATLNCHNRLLFREKLLGLQSTVNMYFVTKPLTTERSFQSTTETRKKR